MTVDAPTAGTLLMVLNHDSAFKSWHWPPKCKAHCRHNDDFTYDITYYATIWRRSLQIVAKCVVSYIKSSLCLQCALNLCGQCHDLMSLSWFSTISSVPAVGASTVVIWRQCRDLTPPTVPLVWRSAPKIVEFDALHPKSSDLTCCTQNRGIWPSAPQIMDFVWFIK